MKISELIEHLQKCQGDSGDVEVYVGYEGVVAEVGSDEVAVIQPGKSNNRDAILVVGESKDL